MAWERLRLTEWSSIYWGSIVLMAGEAGRDEARDPGRDLGVIPLGTNSIAPVVRYLSMLKCFVKWFARFSSHAMRAFQLKSLIQGENFSSPFFHEAPIVGPCARRKSLQRGTRVERVSAFFKCVHSL